jgi:SAM-dependent methyltransferase
MSEASDDAQPLAAKDSVPPPAPAGMPDDDVEVVAQAPEVEAPPPPRHDSVMPTSRKLAPPPKPKRDSSQPASMPPAAPDGMSAHGAPSISFQDASAASTDDVASALASSDSLRAIGEALSRDAAAFSASETPTGQRPPVPRPRSQPNLSAISPDGPLSAVPETRPSQDLTQTSPVNAPLQARDKHPTLPDDGPSSLAPKSSSIFAQRIISVGIHSDRPPPPPPPPPPPVELAPSPVAPPPAFESAPEVTVAPLLGSDDDSTDIPIHTDEDEEVTSPTAATSPLETPPPALAVPVIPGEPTPAPPPLVASEAAPAPEERGPDSVDRMPVEELSREDAPSVPPEAPAAPPPAPSMRSEAKPPPPPKRAPGQAAAPAGESEKKKTAPKQKKAWWEELFSEDFVRANWKVSDEQIKREVTFVEESLGVAPGGVVLDLGCGSGQHAVELASRGYGVVGYDLSLYQLALAADMAQERSQKLNFLQGDMREMAFEEMFDGIFCWNTSFGYFEEDKNFSVAERAFRALRPGGMLLIDVMNRDFVAAHTPSSVWFEGDACVCMDDAVIDYFTSRLRVKRSVILDDGRTRECTYSVRLYSFHELGKLLHEVGFRVTEVSGHPATPGVFLGQSSPRILMLAQRP